MCDLVAVFAGGLLSVFVFVLAVFRLSAGAGVHVEVTRAALVASECLEAFWMLSMVAPVFFPSRSLIPCWVSRQSLYYRFHRGERVVDQFQLRKLLRTTPQAMEEQSACIKDPMNCRIFSASLSETTTGSGGTISNIDIDILAFGDTD